MQLNMTPEKFDDENGNCKRCGHPFNPHQIFANPNDLSKGGVMKCPVDGCDCVSDVSFELN